MKKYYIKYLRFVLIILFCVFLSVEAAWRILWFLNPDNPRNYPKDMFSTEKWLYPKNNRYKLYNDLLNRTNNFKYMTKESLIAMLGKPDSDICEYVNSEKRIIFSYELKEADDDISFDSYLYLDIVMNSKNKVVEYYIRGD